MTLRDVSNRGGCCVSSVFVVLNMVHWSRGLGTWRKKLCKKQDLGFIGTLKSPVLTCG